MISCTIWYHIHNYGGWQQAPAWIVSQEDQWWIVMIQGHSRRWARSIHYLRVQPGLGNVISWYKMRRWQWELEGVPNPCWCRFCYPMSFPKSLSPIVSVDTLSAVRNHVWDWRAKPLHPTSSGKTLHHNLSSSHSCRKPEYSAIFYWSARQIKPSQRTASFVTMTEYSWSNQSLVAVLWQRCGQGRQGGWSMSTIIFQAPMLETSNSLVTLLAVCCFCLPLQLALLLGPHPPWFWVLHCFCAASAITSRSWLCHQVYLGSEVVQLDGMWSRVPHFPHRMNWAESAAFHFNRLTWVGRKSYINLKSMLILEGYSHFRFAHEISCGTYPSQAVDALCV